MKKALFIIGGALVLIIVFMVFRSRSTPEPIEGNTNEAGPKPVEIMRAANTITIGLYRTDTNEMYVDMLEKLLTQKGFKTVLVDTLPDPASLEQQRMTIFYRSSSEDALLTLEKEAISRATFRKGQVDSIEQDLVIGPWEVEDFSWGELNEEAQALLHPEMSDISISVLNAGAEPGSAGKMATLLEEAGYTNVEAENADEGVVVLKPLLIYHDRFFKEVAKDIRTLLTEQGYENISYRWRTGQGTDIVIELGPADAPDLTRDETLEETEAMIVGDTMEEETTTE